VTDHDELRALLQRYSRAADERDLQALAGLFTADAHVDGARGDQAIDRWLDTMRAPRAFPTSMHDIGEPLIEVGSDGDTAALDAYAVVYQLADTGSGGADLTLGMRYLVDARRHDGHWRIERLTTRTIWMR
jgi:uncharacterized protein (TIGR02246 family)